MRYIQKGHAPESLRDHRRAGGTYATYTATDELRAALLGEQGSLCCYCMQRIELRAMKIEHWAPQSVHPDLQLDYHNLLGACVGEVRDDEPDADQTHQKSRRESQHCDTRKGNTEIKVHPADPKQRCDRLVKYRFNGEVYSDDPDVQRDLNETLNLNATALRRRRNGVLTGLSQQLAKVNKGQWPPELIRREIEAWQRRDDEGKLPELCQVVVYYLQKRKLPAGGE